MSTLLAEAARTSHAFNSILERQSTHLAIDASLLLYGSSACTVVHVVSTAALSLHISSYLYIRIDILFRPCYPYIIITRSDRRQRSYIFLPNKLEGSTFSKLASTNYSSGKLHRQTFFIATFFYVQNCHQLLFKSYRFSFSKLANISSINKHQQKCVIFQYNKQNKQNATSRSNLYT